MTSKIKIISSFVILLFLANVISAQDFEYERIPTNFKGDLHHVAYLPSGYIFGVLSTPNKVAFSNDNGSTWNYSFRGLDTKPYFRGNSDSEIFMSADNFFYKLDIVSNTFIEVDLGLSFPNIKDFIFLEDNSFILAGSKAIYLFDENFNQLAKYDYGFTVNEVQIEKNELGNYYLMLSDNDSNRLFETDNQLVSLDLVCNISEDIFSRLELFTYHNGIFYFEEFYSQDPCLDWEPYSFLPASSNGVLNVSSDGTIVFDDDNFEIGYTSDFGITINNLNYFGNLNSDDLLYAENGTI